jgi:copper chaperone CopZ
MKKLLIISTMVLLAMQSNAQFTKATLQATGLTCAMCSNAINKALQKVDFVESVKSDIKNSAFAIVFKPNAEVNIEALKDAVEGAGFSIGSLKVTGNFEKVKVAADQYVKIGQENFHFLNVPGDQILNGETTIILLDKNFVTAKELKKYAGVTKMSNLQTGKTVNGERIYHVTVTI